MDDGRTLTAGLFKRQRQRPSRGACCLLSTGYFFLLFAHPRPDRRGFADYLEEAAEARAHVRAQLDADGATAAGRERAEVAERLRLLERREGEGLAGYRNVARVGRRYLDEDAAVGAALVELAGRVQEARAV